MGLNNSDISQIHNIALKIRKQLENKYGITNDSMIGKCIEASDTIVNELRKIGYNSEAKQVWCLYEYFEGCSDCPYEEHWIATVTKGKDNLYIDITMNQFQWAFITKELPRIYISSKIPNFYLPRKPGKTTLDKCGWNDWYNYGNYINNFDYWGNIK